MALNGLARTQPWKGATLRGRVGCRLSDMSNVFARARLPPTWGLATLPAAGRGSTEASAPAPPPAQPAPASAAKGGNSFGEAPAIWDAETFESAPEDARAVHGAVPLAGEAHAQARAPLTLPAGAAVQQAGRGAVAGRALAAGALRAIARQAQEPGVQGSQAPIRGSGADAERFVTQSSDASAARSDGRDGVAPNWAASGDLLAALLPRAVAAPDTAAARAAAVLRDDAVSSQPMSTETAAAAQAAAQPAAAMWEIEEGDEHTLAVLELDRLLRLSERTAAKQTSRAAPAVFPGEPAGSAGSQGRPEQGAAAGASAILLQAQALFVSSLPGGARPASPAASSPGPAQAHALFRNAVPGGRRTEAGAEAPATPAAEQAPSLFRNALPTNSYTAGKAAPLESSPAAPAPGEERARRANARVRFSLGHEDVQDASPEAPNSAPGWWASSGGAGLSSGDEALGHDARPAGQASGVNPGQRPGQQPGLLLLDRLPPRRRPRPPPQQPPPAAPDQAAHETLAPTHPGAGAGAPGASAPPARARRRAPPGKPRDRGPRDGARRGTAPMADSLLAVWRAAGGLDDPEPGPSAPDAGAGRGLANGVDADAANGHVNADGNAGGRAADAEPAAGVALLRGRFMGLDDGIAEALLKVLVNSTRCQALLCIAQISLPAPQVTRLQAVGLVAEAGAKQVPGCDDPCVRAAMRRQRGGRGRLSGAVRTGAALCLGRRECVRRRVRPGRGERRVRRRGPGVL